MNVNDLTVGQLKERELTMENEFLSQFFEYKHLPDHLQDVSRPFGILAEELIKSLPRNPERTTALRKLLEAKDCAVRARIASAAEARHAE